MFSSPLFFKPIPFETIWGGTAIKEYYGYDWMPDKTGQAWAFSGQKINSTICESEPFAGKSLRELWLMEPELFGRSAGFSPDFPLIISLLCPCDDLSIQVHPDDNMAKSLGLEHGKNEAWYFLDVADDSEIVFGQNTTNETELREYIETNRWSELIRKIKVHSSDFVYIPAGTLHACCKNVIVYEVQQSTDITYRFYDYDRIDSTGKKRDLQVEKAIEALHYSAESQEVHYTTEVSQYGRCTRTRFLIASNSFRIEKLLIENDSFDLRVRGFKLITVVQGYGTVNGIPLQVGSSFLAPNDSVMHIAGNLTCMITTA